LKFETQEITVNATAGTVDQAIADLLNATEAIDRTINVNVTPANAEAKKLLGDEALTVKAAADTGNNGRPGADVTDNTKKASGFSGIWSEIVKVVGSVT